MITSLNVTSHLLSLFFPEFPIDHLFVVTYYPVPFIFS